MYTLQTKRWFGHFHWHDVNIGLNHVVHDERFWPMVVGVVLIAAFIALVIWAGMYGEASPEDLPTYPYAPYGF